jgi:hypothetical protein
MRKEAEERVVLREAEGRSCLERAAFVWDALLSGSLENVSLAPC